jgi:hypothetical protein
MPCFIAHLRFRRIWGCCGTASSPTRQPVAGVGRRGRVLSRQFDIIARGPMRYVLLLAILVLAACSSESTASRIDARTFKIHGPGVPGGSDAPNRRLAVRICPGGYRVLDKDVHKEPAEDGLFTDWTIRCI